MRKLARDNGYTVEKFVKRGKGSHSIWVVYDADCNELGRAGLTGRSGAMSMTVTRSVENSLEDVFGEGWMDK